MPQAALARSTVLARVGDHPAMPVGVTVRRPGGILSGRGPGPLAASSWGKAAAPRAQLASLAPYFGSPGGPRRGLGYYSTAEPADGT